MPVKGYYQRARVFGYLLLIVAILTAAYYLFQYFTE